MPSRSRLKGQAANGPSVNGAGLLKGEWEGGGRGSAPFSDWQDFAFLLMTAVRTLPEESAVFTRIPHFPPNRFEARPLPCFWRNPVVGHTPEEPRQGVAEVTWRTLRRFLAPGPAVPGRALRVRISLFETRKVRAERMQKTDPLHRRGVLMPARRAFGPSRWPTGPIAPTARWRAP